MMMKLFQCVAATIGSMAFAAVAQTTYPHTLVPVQKHCTAAANELLTPLRGAKISPEFKFYQSVLGMPGIVSAATLAELALLGGATPRPDPNKRIAVDPSNALHLVAVGERKLMQSHDGGQSWTTNYEVPLGQSSTESAINAFILGNGPILISGNGLVMSAGSHYSIDGGNTFRTYSLSGRTITGNPDMLYAINWNGGGRSRDGGLTWEKMNYSGASVNLSFQFFVDPVDPATVYHGSGGNAGGWFGVSRNNGDNFTEIYWRPSTDTDFNTMYAHIPDRIRSGHLYRKNYYGAIGVSFDFGATWASVDTSMVAPCLTTRPMFDAADGVLAFGGYPAGDYTQNGAGYFRLESTVAASGTLQHNGAPVTGVTFCSSPTGVSCAETASGFTCSAPPGFTGTLHASHPTAYFSAIQLNDVTTDQTINFQSTRSEDGLCQLDVNRNGLYEPEIDGVAIVRRMKGFSEESFADLASAGVCARNATAQSIFDASNPAIFNATGSAGSPLATTDGLIIARVMRGLRGAAVTNGAIPSTGATRTTWAGAGQLQEWFSNTCRYNLN